MLLSPYHHVGRYRGRIEQIVDGLLLLQCMACICTVRLQLIYILNKKCILVKTCLAVTSIDQGYISHEYYFYFDC